MLPALRSCRQTLEIYFEEAPKAVVGTIRSPTETKGRNSPNGSNNHLSHILVCTFMEHLVVPQLAVDNIPFRDWYKVIQGLMACFLQRKRRFQSQILNPYPVTYGTTPFT